MRKTNAILEGLQDLHTPLEELDISTLTAEQLQYIDEQLLENTLASDMLSKEIQGNLERIAKKRGVSVDDLRGYSKVGSPKVVKRDGKNVKVQAYKNAIGNLKYRVVDFLKGLVGK